MQKTAYEMRISDWSSDVCSSDLGALLTEEESYIFVQDLRCAGYLSYANVPSYLQWLAGQDLQGTYEYLLDVLKYLQWQGLADPGRRWLLKSPFHLGQEALLARTFPDATLLFTHRPPAQFLSSMCSLMAGYMKWHTDYTHVDGQIGRASCRERVCKYV